MTDSSYVDQLERAVKEVVELDAGRVDGEGVFPRPALEALGGGGLLGLVSARDVGGWGEGPAAAADVVERLARSCASTAMVVCMHYAATAVVEAYGPREIREEIAAGRHLSTLAFSEAGSRSHFWAPVSTASADGSSEVVLNARKSWVTSAGEADSYVWSSRPTQAEGPSTLWLVPNNAAGLSIAGRFDGFGLRGNASRPMTAQALRVARSAMLGQDGKGDEVMLGLVLPYFQVMNAAVSLGIMETTVDKAVAHVAAVRFEHLDSRLADLPTIRAYLARMRVLTDQVRALLSDTLTAMATGREDATLRVLEVKAAASEAATAVTELGMRVCGGAAFRKEGGIERHFRDARAATVMAPTTDAIYDFVGRVMCGMDLFG
jgi:alkylation response protein AidB-like acyl-CoA dehydrogenase